MNKILVIDDNKDNLFLIDRIIKKDLPESKVFTALSGEEGILSAQKILPDVILLDLLMPEMDGFEVCTKLKSDDKIKHIPIIIISAIMTDSESKIKALDTGAEVFIPKPVSPNVLVAQITAMLRIKKAEDKLRDENLILSSTITNGLDVYKDLFENINDFLCTHDLDGKILSANPAAGKLLGYDTKDIIDKNLRQFIAPEVRDQFDDYLKKIKSRGKANGFMIIQTVSGEKRIFEYDNTLSSEELSTPFVRAFAKDVTELKQKEHLLKVSEKKYKDLFEKSGDAILIITNGKFVDCNLATVEMLRYKSKKELLNTHPSELSPEFQPDGKPSFEKADEMMNMAFEKGSHRFEWDHKKADGTVFPVEVLLTVITNDENEKTLYTVWRDITDRKLADRIQKALFEISESSYAATDMAALYKSIHEIISRLMKAKNFYIAIYDENTDMISFPYMVDEFDAPFQPKKFGKGLTEYILKTGEAKLIDAELDIELSEKGEVEMIGEPTEIWLGVPLKVSNKIIGVIVVQDYNDPTTYGENEKQLLKFVSTNIAQVIERKRNNVKLEKYSEELKEANQTKDKFFSIIAHDLKSPFQGLLGYSKILANEFYTLSDEEKLFFINNIDDISNNAFSLLEDLLTWSRLQTGKMEVNIESLNLNEYLAPTISLLSQTALNKGIKLTSLINSDIHVKADINMLRTITRNLISNAIKFTNIGGKIIVKSKLLENFVELTVEDNGVGIKEENLQKLFSIDKSITTRGTAKEEGTGLGLLLCKEMIEKLGGDIRVESEVGKGSSFIYTIPLSN
ncbi:MAG: PAS domain S-box protein [Melioribacteraceae bacterium]|nr:PAS domain S-box protein [Melioribacteraceae bacterium]MCF8394410.1 PAS domain S-box protein [Melioribacteraceae bacterium]MCF8417494.1 PAS domain S-box protein [Melioribacteraceae bacterium]